MNCKKRLGLMPAQRLNIRLEVVFAQANCAGNLAQFGLGIGVLFKVLDCLLDAQVILRHLMEISDRDIHGFSPFLI